MTKTKVNKYTDNDIEEMYKSLNEALRDSAAFIAIIVDKSGQLDFASFNLTPSNSIEIIDSVKDSISNFEDEIEEKEFEKEHQTTDTNDEEIKLAEKFYQENDAMLAKANYIPLKNSVH